ncbi:hypothetical protein [Rhodopirellula europaea]|uniref:Uncharacterized protein n=1 Tax=Rhodopirellula europaea 6C TaxID=1263867 RepID=M2APM5_9BACT|nr:hypothetical protein [Rhodopirellula europaea]EMB14697.1 hypothetical protein RE6C_04504 [Rhodopirellula europaea 6C]
MISTTLYRIDVLVLRLAILLPLTPYSRCAKTAKVRYGEEKGVCYQSVEIRD